MRAPLTPPTFRTWMMSDGYEIQGRVWNPNPTGEGVGGPHDEQAAADDHGTRVASGTHSPPLGGVGSDRHAYLYFHGIQSHGGWFEWSASILAQDGSPVIVPDRRGSGLNREARGDTPSIERWLDDVDEIATWVEREFDITKLRIVGVSWGGK